MVDVVRLGDPQGAEAAQGKLGDLVADLVADLRSIVRMLEHHLQRQETLIDVTAVAPRAQRHTLILHPGDAQAIEQLWAAVLGEV